MALHLSDRVQRIKPSPTLAVSSRAKQLKAQGKDIINLGAGEPDFDTPSHIKAAAIEAINQGKTKYTPADGTVELKQAIIDKFARDNQLTYDLSQVMVSCGGKQTFFNLCQAMLNDGDEVVIPAPYWVSYPDMVLLAGGKPVVIAAGIEQDFKISPAQLAEAITDRTRLFVMNSPSNPSGAIYSADELKGLAEILREHPQVVIATDDMYEHIRFTTDPFVNILNADPELYERTMVLNGVSKAYSMTGWRIGYVAGPQAMIAAMRKVQSQSTSNPCSISQAAALEALSGDQSCVQTMVKAFQERHDLLHEALKIIPGIETRESDGTFYYFPSLQNIINQSKKVTDDISLAEFLIESVGIALVPGSAFGLPGCIRLSFAVNEATLEDAIDRLNQAVEQLLEH